MQKICPFLRPFGAKKWIFQMAKLLQFHYTIARNIFSSEICEITFKEGFAGCRNPDSFGYTPIIAKFTL